MIPFAVVGSERNVIIDGKSVRGRKNRWGVVNVEDEKHCEFVYLRNFLTRYVLPIAVILLGSADVPRPLQNTPAGSYRNHGSDPLRGVPFKTVARAQRADQPPASPGCLSITVFSYSPCEKIRYPPSWLVPAAPKRSFGLLPLYVRAVREAVFTSVSGCHCASTLLWTYYHIFLSRIPVEIV